MTGLWFIIGGLFGMTAVGAGAYGWHSMDDDEQIRQIFMMGVDCQMWHALALLGVAWLAARPEMAASRLPLFSGVAFSLGIILFSGSLYFFTHMGHVPLEGAAPGGGYLMMAGWAGLVLSGWKIRKAGA